MTPKRTMLPTEPEKKRPARLIDVAAAAGVSLTTASHSFSGRRYVAPETKQRIWRAAADLGYLANAPSKTVAILLRPPESLRSSRFGTTSFPNLAGALAVAAMAKGFNVITARDIDDVAGGVPRLDGCILVAPNHNDEVLKKIIASGLPVVSYDPDPGNREFRWWVGAAYEQSTIRLLEHLYDSGARRIALLLGGTDNMYRRAVVSAYMHFMRTSSGDPVLRVADTERGRLSALETTAKLLRISNPPDAIVATSSIFAAGVLDAAENGSVSVPERLMIATMTDGPLAEFASVPITGLRIDAHKSAETILELLERRMKGTEEPNANSRIDLQIIRRLSTSS